VYYPVLLKVADRRALVVGGGPVAARKVRALADAGARVTVVSPRFCEALRRRRDLPRLRRAFRAADLRGAGLVVCASDDPDLQERVWRLCRARGIPVNVVDAPSRCSFIVPAQLRRGPLTIAVATDGASPGLAKALRGELGRLYPPAYGRLVRAVARRRRRIQARVDDPKRRAALLRRLDAPGLVRAMRRGGLRAALRRLA
jgi:siroheme synthase-like protein